MNILVVGDVVGASGVNMVINQVRRLKKEYDASFCIINGENASQNNGITPSDAQTLFDAGADVVTLGNHTFRHSEIEDMLEREESLIRPINYASDKAGKGYAVKKVGGKKIAVINALGDVYMDDMPSAFIAIDSALKEIDADIVVVDFHAEATSEKQALGYYLDGRVSAVFGTHTHVQTADARILQNGTGYITDVGMTGSYNSCLGVKKEIIVDRFTKKLPRKFEFADGEAMLNGAVFKINDENKTEEIITINIRP